MAGMIPMAVYGLEVPCGDMPIPAKSDIPSAFRITMAAIDPSAEPEGDDGAVPRATLKLIRRSLDDEDDEDEDEDDFDADYMDALLAEGEEEDDDESDDDEDLKGGPSDPAKSKKARKEAALKQILAEEGMDLDEDEKPTVNGVKKSAKALGKMPVSDDSDEEDEDDDDDMDVEEFVLCTLDPSKNWQQPLDITVGEREQVFFMVSGTHTIYLTGNYVEPADLQGPGSDMYDPDSDDELDYDLEPDSDELDEDDEDDELDELEDPRITEVDDDDEDEAPTLIEKKADKKGKNKRPAEDEETADANGIDEMIAKAAQKDKTNGEQKLSKKQLKKQKKNDGSANVTSTDEAKKESDAPSSAKSDKKVSFAKELEQGPTPTKDGKSEKGKASLGVKKVQGVTIDDKKLGTGPAAKNGDRVSMRYIGKLEKDNKVFDSNKKGKPFSFKLGAGEVIKGWEIGIQGLTAGGERRITIPAHLAYGSKSLPGIPANSTLVFDVKLLEINKK
ncbi:FK506-binding 4 [Lecanosticta acicola]|uniref:peptidylprolyl isomerase n=1 Tax=Lecanosticta acicola TaxID=111012 RepID=A0AAI9EBA3_9PEZI|nr:FK506-binding 4 [Lecanosticta acicola]